MEGGGDEAMEEMTPEAAAELAAIRAEMDAQRGVVTKKRPAEGDEAKKNKRKKPKVVHSLAEVDEEFQKEIAEEMAAEAEREERGEPPVEATKPAASDMTSEENIALFKVRLVALLMDHVAELGEQSMLAEKDINPFAPWEDALPKFVNDPRYKGGFPLQSLASTRYQASHSCGQGGREAGPFRRLLQGEGTGATSEEEGHQTGCACRSADLFARSDSSHSLNKPSASYSSPKSRRLALIGRTSDALIRKTHVFEVSVETTESGKRSFATGYEILARVRASLLICLSIADVRTVKRADAKRHEDFFLELLGEQPGITPTSEWSQVHSCLFPCLNSDKRWHTDQAQHLERPSIRQRRFF